MTSSEPGGDEKSPGADGIPIELFRKYQAITKTDLLEIYNRMLQAKHIPIPLLECHFLHSQIADVTHSL